MSVEQHLKNHDLRATDIRKKLYAYLLENKSAVSHSELELIFRSDFDRVTIYRTLNTFLEKGLLHKIPNDSGSARYALCKDQCSSHEHIDNHVHFKCTECDSLICLHETEIPMISLPEKYKALNATLLYEGLCNKCN